MPSDDGEQRLISRDERPVVPRDQTQFGDPYGNCFAASVATIIGRQTMAVPNFNLWGKHWVAAAQLWC